jgi:hypothetical protein
MPESFEVKAVADTIGKNGTNDGSVGGAACGDIPIILKSNSIGRLDSIGFPDPSNPSDQQLYVYTEISDKVGAVSHWASTQVNQELLFLGRDNIYCTDGQQVRSVADQIQATIRALGFSSTQIVKVSCENDVKYKRVYFQVFFNSAASAPAYTLVGDYRQYPNFRWTWYTPGTNSTTHPGIRAGCLFQVTNTTDGTKDIYAGNIDQNGQLYKLNDGTNDNSLGIYQKIVTRPYAMERPLNQKLYKKAGVHLSGNGGFLFCLDVLHL